MQAINFNKTGSLTYNQPVIAYGSSFTIDVWLKLNSLTQTNHATLFMRGTATNANGVHIYNNTLGFRRATTNDLGGELEPISNLEINKWYRLTFVFASQSMKYYRDGKLINTVAFSGSFTTTSAISFGDWSGDYGTQLDGAIHDFKFYNRSLNDTELEKLFKSTSYHTPFSDSLVLQLKFNGESNYEGMNLYGSVTEDIFTEYYINKTLILHDGEYKKYDNVNEVAMTLESGNIFSLPLSKDLLKIEEKSGHQKFLFLDNNKVKLKKTVTYVLDNALKENELNTTVISANLSNVANAYDGNTTTLATSTYSKVAKIIGFYSEIPLELKKINLSFSGSWVKTYYIEASDDNVTWNNLITKSVTLNGSTNVDNAEVVTNITTKYKYFRVRFLGDGDFTLNIKEISFNCETTVIDWETLDISNITLSLLEEKGMDSINIVNESDLQNFESYNFQLFCLAESEVVPTILKYYKKSHWVEEVSFIENGMDSLSPLLDRRIETLEPIPMTDKSEILQVDEVGKVFSKTIDLKKYLDIRSMKVEVK